MGHLRTIKDAGDNTSAGALEKRLGDDTANVVTQNRPRWFAWLKSDKQHEAEHPHRRPLLLTQEVLQITADEEIILRSRHEARASRKIRWWRKPVLGPRRWVTSEEP